MGIRVVGYEGNNSNDLCFEVAGNWKNSHEDFENNKDAIHEAITDYIIDNIEDDDNLIEIFSCIFNETVLHILKSEIMEIESGNAEWSIVLV